MSEKNTPTKFISPRAKAISYLIPHILRVLLGLLRASYLPTNTPFFITSVLRRLHPSQVQSTVLLLLPILLLLDFFVLSPPPAAARSFSLLIITCLAFFALEIGRFFVWTNAMCLPLLLLLLLLLPLLLLANVNAAMRGLRRWIMASMRLLLRTDMTVMVVVGWNFDYRLSIYSLLW